eukprot:TRINITY_DN3416_c0_g1_i2.p1 TRINITY_DN3416_c0_g1~~TRINITY_DN3416_c0_g1_i2.p1  ORF type:complete len:417 (+),score=208.46 TRINITY_DN3416_c0_g1_i2:127-1377(+)
MADEAGEQILTCITCHLTFAEPSVQRLHYQSEFHRFNLKRKVAELPPVTEDLYLSKLHELENESKPEIVEDSYHCAPCKKKFVSENSYEDHIKSKKHKEAEAKVKAQKKASKKKKAAAAKIASSSSSSTETSTPSTSTSTSTDKTQLEGALKKEAVLLEKALEKKDSSSSPDTAQTQTDLLDEEGMSEEEKEIAKRVRENDVKNSQCMMCKKVCGSVEGLLDHMARRHTFAIPDLEFVSDMDALIDYLQQKVYIGYCCLACDKPFQSVSAVQLHMEDKGHCFLSEEAEEDILDFYNYEKSWQEDRMLSLVSAVDAGKVELRDGGYSLALASGRVIGHRDLAVYYRQRHRDPLPSSPSALALSLQKYRALGWYNSPTEAKRDLKLKTQIERAHHANKQSLGWKANSLQRHFRRQVDF